MVGGPAALAARLETRLRRIWFGPRGTLDAIAGLLLAPLGAIVGAVAAGRRRQIAQDKAQARPAGQPKVVVVGNLVVGGTGKTPLLIALATALAARGSPVRTAGGEGAHHLVLIGEEHGGEGEVARAEILGRDAFIGGALQQAD
jgi:hypothetical protein